MFSTRRRILKSGLGALTWVGIANSQVPNSTPDKPPMDGFDIRRFTDSTGRAHRVWTKGDGPPVLVLHELPGMTRADIRFARRLADEGYRVVLPLLFGGPGDDGALHTGLNILLQCSRARYDCNANNRTPHPVAWIHELCNWVPTQWKVDRGMGVVGMCLTGAFPLALLDIEHVLAPVICQPTSPVNIATLLHLPTWNRKPKPVGIGVSDTDLNQPSTIPILGIRYDGDRLCPSDRFDLLSTHYKDRFFRLDLAGKHHSSLGKDFSCLAFEHVRRFFQQQLGTPDPNAPFPLYAHHGLKGQVLTDCCPWDSCNAQGHSGAHLRSPG